MGNRNAMAAGLISKLNEKKKIFSDLKQGQKSSQESCCICCEDFTDEAVVSELNCDDRHIFHTACI